MEQFNQFMIKNAIQNILIKLILLLGSIGIIEFLSKTLSFSHLYYQALIGLAAFLFLVYFVFYYDSINNKLKKYFVFSSDADLHAIPVYAGVFVILRNLCVWDTALLVTIFVIIIPVMFSLFVGGSPKEQQEKNLIKVFCEDFNLLPFISLANQHNIISPVIIQFPVIGEIFIEVPKVVFTPSGVVSD